MPFRDEAGHDITDPASWTRARNQQRNWETINQIISLRCLPESISLPQSHDHEWWFEFEISDLATISVGDGDLGLLIKDAQGTPMITGLDESPGAAAVLQPGHNIWFQVHRGK